LPIGKELTLELILQQQILDFGDAGIFIGKYEIEFMGIIQGWYGVRIERANGVQGVLILYDEYWKGVGGLESLIRTELILEAKTK
jgi:hypothetical protein